MCPDLEVLAVFLDGLEAEERRAQIVEHLADCDDCRELVADVGSLSSLQLPRHRVVFLRLVEESES